MAKKSVRGGVRWPKGLYRVFTCESKNRYTSEVDANLNVLRLRKEKPNFTWNSYVCTVCHFWHLTTMRLENGVYGRRKKWKLHDQ